MDKQEKIVCAAIRMEFDKCGSFFEEVLCGVDYTEIKESFSYGEISSFCCLNFERTGFITNKNRFIDPKEAMRVAIDAKQMIDIDSVIGDINLEIEAIEFLVDSNDINEKFSTKKLESLRRKLTRFLKLENRDELKPEDIY